VTIALRAVTVQAGQDPPLRLTLQQAITLALKNNVSVLTTRADVDEAAATRERRFSALLPHVTADALANRQNRNLAAAGLTIPNIPTVVGPYSYMDFRLSANEPLIDRQAYHEWKSSAKAEDSAALTNQDTRDLVVRQAAGLYLACETAAAEVEASTARVVRSDALLRLARDQRDQQLATGVDVVRAQVQFARDRQNALVAQNTYQTSLLSLARFLGLDLGLPIELTERLQLRHVDIPPIEEARRSALATRADYQAFVKEREGLDEQREAARARRLPKLAVSGDYGALGSFGSLPAIGEVQATLSITLFDRDRVGELQETRARIQRLDQQMADLARGIEQELRTAILDLESTEEQVDVTEAALDLATRELAMTEDRFRNGVSDNIEVVTAQDALARALDDRIGALARHADARMALARALGGTEQSYVRFLGEP